jgi:glutathione S-transferase
MIRIYYAPPSIYGRKVLAALEEKGLDYEIERMNFSTQDHLKPDYLKLNPNGEVPTLADEDLVIYESTAIIEYLNDEYPEPPLLPEDSADRARVRMVEDFCDLHLYPALVKCMIKKVLKKETLTEADLNAVSTGMKRLENYLGTQPFIAGKMFTFADCAVMAGIATWEALGLQTEGGQSKLFQDYANKLKKRPGYKGAARFKLEAAAPAQPQEA